MRTIAYLSPLLLLLYACTPSHDADHETVKAADEAPVGAVMDDAAGRLIERIRTLSSDDFGGRMPATAGGRKTVSFLIDEFGKAGAMPGNGDDYTQRVPLVEITASPEARLVIEDADGVVADLTLGGAFAGGTRRMQEVVTVEDSDVVFVGYGIVAPEFGWDDYRDLDVSGKTVVMLVNDPGYATGDDALFNGKAMTYYGRWTYKFEEAARQGAHMAIIIHEEGAAGYPWGVVTSGWTGPQFDLVRTPDMPEPARAEAWVDNATGRMLLERAGLSYEEAVALAAGGDFRVRPLAARASLTLENRLRTLDSSNIIARIPGSKRPDEYVIYTAHWDHLGTDPALEDDPIYNGARDNATGTAALLTLAEQFSAMDPPPDRSVIFLAVTAEESGLLGSRYYAEHPLYPLEKTVANINMDSLGIYGRTHDIAVIGFGNSELEDYLSAALENQGRRLEPESTPEKGFFYRSDHFNFAKKGVPALYFKSGIDFVGKGEAWGRSTEAEHIAQRYHKPGDEYDPQTWSTEGLMEDIALYFEVGRLLAMDTRWPNWREGNEFRAARDASRDARRQR